MAGSRDLYELIASLGKSEKRYCMMMLQAGPGRRAASCRRLFEILCRMERPDECSLRAAVGGESFAGHLAVTKNHLYEHLLRSLRSFAAAGGVGARIYALIADADLLIGRDLHRQARARLRDARELAERYDYLPSQLTIARMELHIDSQTGYAGTDPDRLRERRARVDGIQRNITNLWDYLDLYAAVSLEMGRRGYGGEDAGERLREIVEKPLGELDPPASMPARVQYIDTLRMYYMMTARHREAYLHSVRSLEIVEAYPMDDRLEHLNYVSLLHNHVATSLRIGRIAEAREAYEKLRELRPRRRVSRLFQAQLCFACRLDLLSIELDHEGLVAMAGELEELGLGLGSDSSFMRQMRICHAVQTGYVQFACGHLREAAATLHAVINDVRPGYRDDLLCNARVLQLMVHYDLGDIELLPYLIRSTYRFISRCRGVIAAERVLLRFMRRLTNVATRDGLNGELCRVRRELLAATVDPAVREAAAVDSILPWLDAKLTGRPFGELVRESILMMGKEEEELMEPEAATL